MLSGFIFSTLVFVFLLAVCLWFFGQTLPSMDPVDHLAPQPLEKIDTEPDAPIAFGYKCTWLAIRSMDVDEVVNCLPISDLRRANWKSGREAVYKNHTFVSPSVNGWVFVVSHQLPELGYPPHQESWSSLMSKLSIRFDDVQYFGTHRVSSFHAWAWYRAGAEQRAFSFADHEWVVGRGTPTEAEMELGFEFPGLTSEGDGPDEANRRGGDEDLLLDDLWSPCEQDVMDLASIWSIDPCTLDELDLPKSVGWIGNLEAYPKSV